MTSNGATDPKIEEYLKHFRWALSSLPAEDRTEIVEETRFHFVESVQAAHGQMTIDEITAELGPPDEYARRFLQNYEITVALASGSAWQMLRRSSPFLGRGVRVSCTLVSLLILYGIAMCLLVVALMKPLFPEHVGFWTSSETSLFALGYIEDFGRTDRVEHLGYWIVPLGVAFATLTFLGATALLRRFLRSLRSIVRPLARRTAPCGTNTNRPT